MKIMTWATSAPMIATAIFLTGCKNGAQTRKIKELEAQAVEYTSEIEILGNKLREAGNERDKAQNDLSQAQRDVIHIKEQVTSLQAQLEAMRKAEEAAREAAKQVAAERQPAEDFKKTVEDRISAIWHIEGDQGSCRGIITEVEGKTWLYFPARSLKGSAKLTVKDASGAAVTKFGDFQVAADANLARLEIKQDAPVRFKVDANTELEENSELLTANTPPDGGATKVEQAQAGTISATDIEFNSSHVATSHGLPVFNAKSGALVGITVAESSGSTELWDSPQGNTTDLSHAARLNRPIDWKPSNMGALLAARRKIDELIQITRLIDAAALLRPTASGLNMQATVGAGNISVRQVLEQSKHTPGVPELIKLDETLAAQKVRIAEADIKRQFSSHVGAFSHAGQKAAADLKAIKVSPCDKADAENALKWNEAATKKLTESLSSNGH